MHRADQIIEAVVAAIRARASLLQVSPDNVYAHRTLSLSEDAGEIPALTVNYGEDAPESELGYDSLAFVDSFLAVAVTGFALGSTEDEVRRALLNQRRYVHVALMADQTLGLEFVIGIRYGGAAAPEFDASVEAIPGSIESRWIVHYRMNITDPGD